MKPWSPRFARLAILGALCLAAAGCDSFSLPDQFLLPGEGAEALKLTVDTDTTQRYGTVALTASGGVKPYSFDEPSPFEPLYEPTSDQGLGSVFDDYYTAGGAIGKIRITVQDAAGATAFAYVTVVPPTPTLTGERTGGDTNATLSWTCGDWGIIDSIAIQGSSDATNFVPITTATANGSYNDNGPLDPSKPYTYRIVAKAGNYSSLPLDFPL